MAICEWCGKEFDPEAAEVDFETRTYRLQFDHLEKCLCSDCAVKAIEDMEDGVYYETCDRCGKRFDLIEESGRFDSYFDWSNGTDLRDWWEVDTLCCDCALEEVEENQPL